jgi:spermidine/putrescine transport system ATP-binding protein
MTILELNQLEKYYGANHVVKNLSLQITEGEFLTILGPSGCGKTTTLRMIGGFELPASGTIWLHGKDITALQPHQRNVNTVFQNYALFPNMTVSENIAFGLHQQKKEKAAIARRVGEMLEMVRLKGCENRKPQELSGGEQQRVAIARAVACDPDILLLDEPLGSLDLRLRKQMQTELKNLHRELGKTFIYVTHDQEEALTMSDRIAVMNEGVLEQLSTSEELYYYPQTKFVADFIGEANILEGKALSADSAEILGVIVPVPVNNYPIGCDVQLFVRPEHISLSPKFGRLKGIITNMIFVGTNRKYIIEIPSGQSIIAAETTLHIPIYSLGQEIWVDWDSGKASLFW